LSFKLTDFAESIQFLIEFFVDPDVLKDPDFLVKNFSIFPTVFRVFLYISPA
jgi:hypothetical protein